MMCGDYLRTATDFASMESANESAQWIRHRWTGDGPDVRSPARARSAAVKGG